MNKIKLIIFSILIVLTFGILFYTNQPDKAPKGEMEELLKSYKGQPGFAIMYCPKFLLQQFLEQTDTTSLKMAKKNNHKFALLIFHEKEELAVKLDSINQEISHFLNNKEFKKLETEQRDSGHKHVYSKKHEDNWRESVIIFEEDSALFAFNLINKLKSNRLKELMNILEKERPSFK